MATREVLATLGFDIEAESIEKFDAMVTNSKKEMNNLVKASAALEQKQERLRKLTARREILEGKLLNNKFDQMRLEQGAQEMLERGAKLRADALSKQVILHEKLKKGTEAEQKVAQDNYAKSLQALAELTKKEKARLSQMNKLKSAYESIEDQMEANRHETKKAEKQVKGLNDQMEKGDQAAVGIKAAEKELAKLEARAKRTEKAMSALDSIMGGMKRLFAGGALAIGAAGTAMAYYTAQTAEFAEESVRSSEALGGSISDYQKYRFAFGALGASQDDLMDGFATITDRAVDAIEGSKTYAKEFTRIGISVDSLKGKKPIELFEMYTDAASKATDKTQVLTSAVRLFGDDLGRRIMPALIGSSESFTNFLKIAETTGVILGEDLTRGAYKARFSVRLLTAVGEGLAKKFSAKLLPTIGRAADAILGWVKNLEHSNHVTNLMNFVVDRVIGQFLSWQKIIAKISEKLGPGGMVKVVQILTAAFIGLGTALSGAAFLKGMSAFIGFMGGGVTLLKFAAIVGIVGTVVMGLIVLLGDLRGYFMGDASVFGALGKKFPEVQKALDALGEKLPAIRAALSRVADAFGRLFERLTPEDREKMLEWFAVQFIQGVDKTIDRLVALADTVVFLVDTFAPLIDVIKDLLGYLDDLDARTGAVQRGFEILNPLSTVMDGLGEAQEGARYIRDGYDAKNLMRGPDGLSKEDAYAKIAARRAMEDSVRAGSTSNTSNSSVTISQEVNVQGVPGADAASQKAFGNEVAAATAKQTLNGLLSGQK